MSVALVTGASAGIGLSVSRKLAAQGWKIALVARTERTLREAAASLPTGAGEVFVCDVEDLAACEALPQKVVARLGSLDLLVNNAGFHKRGPLLDVDPRDLVKMITVNLAAPVVLTRAAVPLMRAGGHIVNVASLAGMVPTRFIATYGASKAGLRAFSRALRDELLPRGIGVSVVSPGPVDTGFYGAELERVADINFSQPMVSADEVADAVLACIRDGTAEIALPWLSAKLCTLGYLSPGLSRVLRPALEKRGARNKAAYIRRKRAAPPPPT